MIKFDDEYDQKINQSDDKRIKKQLLNNHNINRDNIDEILEEILNKQYSDITNLDIINQSNKIRNNFTVYSRINSEIYLLTKNTNKDYYLDIISIETETCSIKSHKKLIFEYDK